MSFVIRWMIPALSLVVLSLIIWFVGPVFDFLIPEIRRWICIGSLLALWIAYRLGRSILVRRREAHARMNALTEQPANPDEIAVALELATLRRHMAQALVVLKKTRVGGRGRRNLYELPWYLVIGAPGSGKTTAVVNSGLSFPLAMQLAGGAVHGVGATQTCEWSFTDQAVLLDTAGRYVTHDRHPAIDKGAWLGLLDLLKSQRSRRPLDGALIAISVADMLLSSDAERAAHASAIRARIQELHARLGVRLPIYLTLTQMDRVPGFMAFFEGLNTEERAQVWGMTFALGEPAANGPLAAFQDEFALLEYRLNARLVERLQQERDPLRRDLIYGFPQHFADLKQALETFLDTAFKPNSYEEPALLRGVYFTSATQEGGPVEHQIGAMAQSLNLSPQPQPPHPENGRSYFLEKVFTAVAFAERGLVGANPAVERRHLWVSRGALAATVVAVLTVCALWSISYRANQVFMSQVDSRIAPVAQSLETVSPAQRDVLSVLPLLNAARHLATDPPGWAQGLGIYQGDRLEAKAGSVYEQLLVATLSPRLVSRIEEQLHEGGTPDFLYEGLKAYLMFADPEHYDADFLSAWIALDWERSLPRELPADQRVALRQHLQGLFTRGLPIAALDPRLIEDLRHSLRQWPLAHRIYERVKRQPLPEGIPDFRVTDAAGHGAALVFVRKSGKPLNEPLSGLFTTKGYREAFRAASAAQTLVLSREQWVLGLEPDAHQDAVDVAADVRRLYFEDYLRQWDALLADIDFVPVSSVAQAADVLRVISGPSSPLKKLFVAIAAQTDLQQENRLLAEQGRKVDSNVDQMKLRLGSLLGQENIAGAAVGLPDLDPVSAKFAGLKGMLSGVGGEPPAIDRLLEDLNALQVQISAMVGASGEALLGEARQSATAAASRVGLTVERQPPLVQGLFKSVVSVSTDSMMGDVHDQLNAAWMTDVVAVYRQSLKSRYPLSAGSARDATLDDFGEFFGMGGVMDRYFRKYLQPYTDTTSPVWRWQPGAAQKLGINPAILNTFQRAAAIRDAFFRAGGTQPIVRFELKPMRMDTSINHIELEIDGQLVGYDHGPSRTVSMQWPNTGSVGGVRLSVSPAQSGDRSALTLEGPWAWLRFLDQSSLTAGSSPDRFNLAVSLDGANISYELRAASAFNPFKRRVLRGFSLPEQL
jgi:type VI secretion system protein ImpL